MTGSTALRARFSAALSALYATEVPAYQQLLDVSGEINAAVVARDPRAEQLGDLCRVTAERHGAVRVGTPEELRQLGVVLAAFGMHPVDFYDLRTAAAPVPVVSTAFRPVEPDELASNPFRLFVSVLVPEDRRFFDADLAARVGEFLSRRTLFPAELLSLAEQGSRTPEQEDRLLRIAVEAFALSSEPVDRGWYDELSAVSSVAADIAGVGSTHINHLTPRVLDIEALHATMTERGVTMIPSIEGPPAWGGPDVLLRQTSFRALAEPRTVREPDGSVVAGALRVRFGEVEQRGVALTAAGHALYEECIGAGPEVWRARWPADDEAMAASGLAFYRADGTPVVYEDFLPRSAAGIFTSNLTSGSAARRVEGVHRDRDWLSGVLEREVVDPLETYAAQV